MAAGIYILVLQVASKEDQLAKERAAKNEAVAELCLLKAQLAQAIFFLFFSLVLLRAMQALSSVSSRRSSRRRFFPFFFLASYERCKR